jgi:hypothetical protein
VQANRLLTSRSRLATSRRGSSGTAPAARRSVRISTICSVRV